jgi:signal transduction histidine kinase
MKLKTTIYGLICAASLLAAADGERGGTDGAMKMAKDAAAYLQKTDPATAFAEFNDPANKQWHNKDLYVFCYDNTGKVLCHGTNRFLIGRNLATFKTVDGKLLTPLLVNASKKEGGDWTEVYKWQDPESKQIMDKKSYVIGVPKIEGLVGVGTYLTDK